VPDTFEAVYPVAPLAYYLAATVEVGPPELEVGGTVYPLGGDDDEAGPLAFQGTDLSSTAHQLLQHIFTLDCIVRTTGFYEVDLQAQERLATQLSLPLEDLYEASFPKRTQAYLALPHAPINDVAPQWQVTAEMTPSPEEARALPYLASRLANIRVHQPAPATATRSQDTESGGTVAPSTETAIHTASDSLNVVTDGSNDTTDTVVRNYLPV
jgi:hypothetical protein